MSEQRSASLTEEAVRLRERLLDVPWDVPPAAWYGRLAALALVAAWGTATLFSRMTDPPLLLHLSVILFHEAGHVLFAPFGEALRIAGDHGRPGGERRVELRPDTRPAKGRREPAFFMAAANAARGARSAGRGALRPTSAPRRGRACPAP